MKHRDLYKRTHIMFLYSIIYKHVGFEYTVRKIITPTYNLLTRLSEKKNSINNNNNKFELLHDAFIFRMKIIANASHVHVILFLSVILQPARV